jgi:hypothetical protein
MEERTKEQYDLFVTYKKEDISVVRPVVDALIAAGVEAWFAEWRILLSEAEEFEDEIDSAIVQSKGALIFANARWLASADCQREAAIILSHLAPEKIVVVEVGDCEGVYRQYPQLRKALVVPAKDNPEAAELFDAIAKLLQITASPAATRWLRKDASYVPAMPLDKFGLKVDLESFRRRATERIVRRPENSAGQYGYGEEENGLRLSIECISHSTTLAGSQELLAETPDFEAYDKLRSYADQWARLSNYEPEGLHFLTCGLGTPQGFTYCHDSLRGHDNYYWERRYILHFGDKNDPQSEVHFIFSKMYSKGETTKNDQRDFCSYTPLFERIVNSASLDPKAARIRPYAVGLASLKAVVALFAVLVATAYTSAASVLVAAALAIDATLSWIDRGYRVLQSMHWGGPISPEGGEHCTPSRAFRQGALSHAPSTLFFWGFEVLLRICAWAVPMILCVLAFNRLAPQHAQPLEHVHTVLVIAALATVVAWQRQVSSMKRVE